MIRRRVVMHVAALLLLVAPARVFANGADLPSEIVLQGFLKPEGSRVRLLIRVPLVLLSGFALPQRGPGYLDLARISDRLNDAAQATGRQIEISDNGAPLIPMVRAARISVLSDRSFGSYAAALSSLEGPRLPVDTELFWSQGFFDAELEYPLHSADAHLSIRADVAPELLRRVKLQLTFLPAGAPALVRRGADRGVERLCDRSAIRRSLAIRRRPRGRGGRFLQRRDRRRRDRHPDRVANRSARVICGGAGRAARRHRVVGVARPRCVAMAVRRCASPSTCDRCRRFIGIDHRRRALVAARGVARRGGIFSAARFWRRTRSNVTGCVVSQAR